MRALLVAMMAICLAVFPVGMSLASARVPAQPLQVATVHAHPAASAHERGLPHEHGSALMALDATALHALDAGGDDCSHHGSGGKSCATCCGFACHAFEPVMDLTLGAPLGRALQLLALREEQVGGGLPFSIERPPRSA